MLYKINQTNSSQLKQIISPIVNKKYSNIIQNEDYFIIEKSGTYIYSVILLTNNDKDCFFYFLSNKNDTTLKDEILKTLKNNDFEYKAVKDKNLKTFFYNQAYTTLSNSSSHVKTIKNPQNTTALPVQNNINYDFSDEAQKEFDKINGNLSPIILKPVQNQINIPQNVVRLPEINSSNINTKSPQTLKGGVVYVDEGVTLTAGILSDITSDAIANSDRISAELDQDWIYNGILLAPTGSILNGYVIDSKTASFAMANGRIGIEFNELMTPDGNIIPLTSNRVYIIGDNSRAVNIGKRVAAGAAIGLMISALSMIAGADPGPALISGLAIGAGGSALTVLTSKGEEVRLIEGSQIKITITEPMTIQPYKE